MSIEDLISQLSSYVIEKDFENKNFIRKQNIFNYQAIFLIHRTGSCHTGC